MTSESTVFIQDFTYFNPHLTCTCTGVDSRDIMPYRPAGLGPSRINVDVDVKTGPQTDDVWRILWRQREREIVATDFLRRPYATPEWRWFWHANKIYVITPFMLNGLYRNMPVFLEDSFLILEHKVSFGFVAYPLSVLIYKNVPRGKLGLTSRLSCQWSVA